MKGVKGPSPLCIHPPFDMVRGIAIDSLHCIYLGVTKHLHLWFDKERKMEDYYIGDKVITDFHLIAVYSHYHNII